MRFEKQAEIVQQSEASRKKKIFIKNSSSCYTRYSLIYNEFEFLIQKLKVNTTFKLKLTFASFFVTKSTKPNPLCVPVPTNFFGNLTDLRSPKTLK